MPATLTMKLNRQQRTWLVIRTVADDGAIRRSSYPVFSGEGEHRNNPDSTDQANAGPLPKGRYFVVDRPSGGTLGPLRDALTGRDEWFALYRDDGRVNDTTTVNGVRRGQFRMHPGTRSVGCVTFINESHFTEARNTLLAQSTETLPGGSTTYYGILTVE